MADYDLIIRDGMIYDGGGEPPYRGDVAINGDVIAAVGDLNGTTAKREINAGGLAVAPGFINMLSWSIESLIEDGRSQSEIRQGVTLEVMGEGTSMGPLSEKMKAEGTRGILGNDRIKYDVEWTTLGQYLEWLEKRGVSTNIASFVGSSTLRIHALGYDDRQPTAEEMAQMIDLLRAAMAEGAMGMSAALIYPPASYASTDELVALAQVVAEYNGMYISHIRGEGSTLLDALGEFIEIVDVSQVTGEIYHLKAAGLQNWELMDEAIEMIEEARESGLSITADMYTYPFSGTGLSSCIAPWHHEGGHEALITRLKDPATREKIRQELAEPSDEWENMYLGSGPENILLSGFKNDALKSLTGKTLAEVAAMRGTSPEDTLMDLIVEDDSRIFTMYFSMSEDNLRKQMALPWVSFCSDAESQAPEGVFLESNPHPRAYGSFARLIGKYVRDEGIIPLEEAVRRLTSFPAANLKIERRGWLRPDHYADVVIFDPDKVQDHATPTQPHQYATGMVHVLVNGVQVLENGDHTGAKPGRFVRGPGYGKKPFEALYPPELHTFLKLGSDYSGNYSEFNLDKSFVPDLIRMGTDKRLYFIEDDSRPEAFAPMHAARRLAQLGVTEAIKPLLILLELPNQDMIPYVPIVFSDFGLPALPLLADYARSPLNIPFSRIGALTCLEGLAMSAGPEAGMIYEGVLLSLLEKPDELENPIVISKVVEMLYEMEMPRLERQVKKAWDRGLIIPDLFDPWETVRRYFNLPKGKPPQSAMPSFGEFASRMMSLMGDAADEPDDNLDDDGYDSDEFDDIPTLPPGTPFQSFDRDTLKRLSQKDKEADKKKKAKRKQTAKLKKQQRKKKR